MQLDIFTDPFRRSLPVRRKAHIIGGYTSIDGLVWIRASKGGIPGRLGQYMDISSIFVFEADHRLAMRMRIEYRSRFIPSPKKNHDPIKDRPSAADTSIEADRKNRSLRPRSGTVQT